MKDDVGVSVSQPKELHFQRKNKQASAHRIAWFATELQFGARSLRHCTENYKLWDYLMVIIGVSSSFEFERVISYERQNYMF